jgi:hypothetical protein
MMVGFLRQNLAVDRGCIPFATTETIGLGFDADRDLEQAN